MKNFIDITSEVLSCGNLHFVEPQVNMLYIKRNIDGTIIRYDTDNCKFDNSNLNIDEMSTVYRIINNFGWNIGILRRINVPEGVRCPDFQNLSSNVLEYWDIKGIYKSQTEKSKSKKITHLFYEAKGQAENIVIDLNRSGCDLSNDEACFN